ncbi:MAG: hypothetical protein WCD35_12920, partial [Mycobacteriales bacterium]
MTTGALDPAYAEAATRRGARDQPPAPRSGGQRRRTVVAAVLVGAGVVTGVAAAQVRQRAHETGDVRRSLVADVRAATRDTDALERQAVQLRAEVARTRAEALGDDTRGQAAAAEVAALE